MIPRIWRLSETSDHNNLGLACTEQGLLLGRTPLIERRGGRFVVRERYAIEQLLSHAYRTSFSAGRIMSGLATVAAALNADDQCLARIAAVHLRLTDLPDRDARDGMEAIDFLLKYARDEGGGDAWNPALHPRAGTPPNPGWFAPTGGDGGESSSTRTAQNDDPMRRSDAGASAGQDWVRLRPGPKRIDELADFAEWFANATPQDENAIRAEIKRYYADVGWDAAAHDLNAKLSVLLRPGVTREMRQRILDSIDLYTRVRPSRICWDARPHRCRGVSGGGSARHVGDGSSGHARERLPCMEARMGIARTEDQRGIRRSDVSIQLSSYRQNSQWRRHQRQIHRSQRGDLPK